MCFKKLFNKKSNNEVASTTSSNESTSENKEIENNEVMGEPDENVNEVHVVCTLSQNKVVYYTFVHCAENISEGELTWEKYKMEDYTDIQAIFEDFKTYITLAHPTAAIKFTPIKFY